jgi:beta-N-acetylhexosaminidase
MILGLSGPALSGEERDFFAASDPLGFILFQRNCVAPSQVRDLVAELRQLVGRPDAPVLIDQEGGRVQRLKPPAWRKAPPASVFGRLFATDPARAIIATRTNARLIASELAALGISVDCAPVLDLGLPDAHDIIGDRAFGDRPDVVIALGRAFADGLRAGGVLPVIKHVPGHGRALADSHLECPVVTTGRNVLEQTDFRPFAELGQEPCWAMTAHIVFADLDPDRPATLSPIIIGETIRKKLGFDGIVLSDDLSMEALSGDLGQRTTAALDAGCDLVLHCNGSMAEMRAVSASCRPLSAQTQRRLARAAAALATNHGFDAAAAAAELDELLAV